ncbi:efflux RND transporter periplasmic adaptor subunit [Geomonas paludis]|uniref:Efflux RND transporter periplasmic adaptor subunit n=1 Tax=Geomonas paludis TaxID=2740185 RepID=A0A6V8MR05_9BACT|nr:efflux RND transporter periplasmic adaptor subunit [Geomonas paludis]UPU35907.1 efflux RND transporter periplasmic adaptor subunit [Geomonas paludis]GFO62510.1 hypothetical protein GMPD_04290 [Geomonas paludis]
MTVIRSITAAFFVVASVAVSYSQELDCYLAPAMTVNVGSEVIGVLAEVPVDRGDYVKKGDVIARLDSKVEQQTKELKRERLEYLTREQERKKQLFKKGIISSQEIDEAETAVKVAQREYDEAVQFLARRTIRSTVDGVVVQRFLSPGERVEEKPIMKLAQIDPINAEIYVPAAQLRSIKVGDKAFIRPEPPGKGEYRGVVKVIDSVVDAGGMYGVRVEVKNPKHQLPAGLKCQVRFVGK